MGGIRGPTDSDHATCVRLSLHKWLQGQRIVLVLAKRFTIPLEYAQSDFYNSIYHTTTSTTFRLLYPIHKHNHDF